MEKLTLYPTRIMEQTVTKNGEMKEVIKSKPYLTKKDAELRPILWAEKLMWLVEGEECTYIHTGVTTYFAVKETIEEVFKYFSGEE